MEFRCVTEYQRAADGTMIPKLDTRDTSIDYVSSTAGKRLNPKRRPKGVTILSVLSVLSGIMYLLYVVLIYVIGYTSGVSGLLGYQVPFLLPKSFLIPILLLGFIYSTAVGIATFYGNNIGRILLMVGGALSLVSIPVGTVYGLIILYYFTRPGIKEFFT
jgi:hypothetical protein